MTDCRDDQVLFSIGTVGVARNADVMDTASDRSDWVKQYNAWQDAPERLARSTPYSTLIPNHSSGIKDRPFRAAEAVAPAC